MKKTCNAPLFVTLDASVACAKKLGQQNKNFVVWCQAHVWF
jgi:hypothetical protein